MSNWLRFRHSIFFKFSLAFLTVGMIPLFVLSFLSLNQITNQVERHTVNNLRQMVLYMSKNADDIFSGYNEISKMMYYNTEDGQNITFDSALRQKGSTPVGMSDSSIDDLLKTVLFSDRYIQNVFFVRTSDHAVFYQSRTSRPLNPNEPFPLINWRYALESEPKKMAVFAPHLESYFGSTRLVMTFARNYIDTSGKVRTNANVLGTLYFDIELDVFEQLFNRAKLGSNDQLFFIDGNGTVIYSNRGDKIGNRIESLTLFSSNALTLSEPIPFLNGRVVALVSKGDLYASLTQIRESVAYAAVICLIALVVMGVVFSRMFTGPILTIMRLMLRVESGNLDTNISIKRKDELGRLAHGFNRMVERLNLFINDAYVSEIKRKQAELNALKSQIRPHYLYNTLEVIRMSAVANDDDQVGEMIHALSKQLKYVIDYGEEWVTLRRELEHLRDYFHLIEVRFDKRIELQIDVRGEELLDMCILKLSIQPLVENAVQHGIRPKGKGTVLVTAEREEDRLVVTVYDNGVGLEEAEVARLNSHLIETEGSTGKSIGVKNVHERIKNACGEGFGLDIESKRHIGTSVRMSYPLLKEAHDETDTGSNGR